MMSGNYGGIPNPNTGMFFGGLGGLGAGLGQLFGGSGGNPFDAASEYYNKIPGAINPYFKPYQEAGQNALSTLTGQYGNLINDPNGLMSRIGAGYQKSPGYDWQLNQGLQAGNNAAAAGGMLGSPQHQQNNQATAQGLANQDYYNYMNKALGLYGTGLSGLQGINQMGFNANAILYKYFFLDEIIISLTFVLN